MYLQLMMKVKDEDSHIALIYFPYALKCTDLLFFPCGEIFSHPIMQLSSLCTLRLGISPATHLCLGSLVFHTPPAYRSPLEWHQTSHPRCPLKKYEIQSSCGVSTQPWTVIMTSLLCCRRAKYVAQAFLCTIPNVRLSLAAVVIWESPTGQLQCKWG